MRLRPEAPESLVRDRVKRVQNYPCRTLFRHNLRLPQEVIAIINRMFRPGQQPKFSAAPAQTGLLSKPKKKASLNSPPIGGVR